MLGMWEVVLFWFLFLFLGFDSFTPLLFARGTIKTKEHTYRQTINSSNALFLFVMVIMVSSRARAMKSGLTFDRSCFEIFHSPPPLYVNLINVLQKSWLLWFIVHFDNYKSTQNYSTSSAFFYYSNAHTIQSEHMGVSIIYSSFLLLCLIQPHRGIWFHSALSRYRWRWFFC